jgi:hypothetical protein
MAAIRVATPEAVSLQLTSTPPITHIAEESEIDGLSSTDLCSLLLLPTFITF